MMLGMSKDKTGIYQIKNLFNNKVYIGSASFIYSRWGQHRRMLRNKQHGNPHLQASWNKYGETQFKFEILEVTTKTLLIEREQWWIDNTGCLNPSTGYNKNPLASSCRGRRWSETSKKKLSQIVKKNTSKEHLEKMTELARQANLGSHPTKKAMENRIQARARDWLLIDPNGKEYKIHNLAKFCRNNNLLDSCLRNVAHGKAKHYKGWQCKKLSDNWDGAGRKWTEEQRQRNSGRKLSAEWIEKSRIARLKTWQVTTPNGNKIIVKDMGKFCKEYNLNPLSMRRVGRGERKTYKGYKCKLLG